MTALPLTVHTAAQLRAIDRYAIEQLRISGYTLMTRAGEAAFAAIRARWPQAHRIVVICGRGNNGGDGYVVARLAQAAGLDVATIALSDPTQLRGDAQLAWREFEDAGGTARPWTDDCLHNVDLIVDAIFGTGLSRPLDPTFAARIDAINDVAAAKFALDIPSGLHADTGAVLTSAIRADATIAFAGLKLGFYLGEGPNYVGSIVFDALGLDSDIASHVGVAAERIDARVLTRALPRRLRTTHKGQQGRVLVIGGGTGMGGAARLTGEAALRVGAGLVTVATKPENVAAIVGSRPELICRGIDRADDLDELLERADVVAIGPGLGQDEWASAMFERALGCAKPAVLDADALNLLARAPRSSDRWILTPHPGEAGRLLGSSAAQIQADRMGSAKTIVAHYGGSVVLKGAGTLILEHDGLPAICDQGNPGMATPGMGDVLTGVIAGILAQCADLPLAARAGVLAHAMAGDLAARRGERGLIASDLFAYLQTCVNPTRSS